MGARDGMDIKDKKHDIILKQRREMSLCGVTDIESFDDTGAVLRTTEGELTLEGEDIKIGTLDTDKGIVTVTGRIDGIYYTNDRPDGKKGIISRFFK